jgi:hypothetical protein
MFLQILAHRVEGDLIHLHQILAAKVELKTWGSLSLSPPWDLGWHRVFQATKGHLFSFEGPPHKNFHWRFQICLMNFIGATKTEKRYKGRAKRTDFIKRA